MLARACLFTMFFLAGIPVSAQNGFPSIPAPDSTRELAPGVLYSHTYMPKQRWSIHVVKADLRNPNVSVHLGKGLEHISGLEQVHSIAHRFDSTSADKRVIAAVNANFWKAGTNHPMGPTVIDGRVLISKQYKNWSSVALTTSGRFFIDNYSVHTRIRTKAGKIPVHGYNYRTDSSDVVLYSSYYGDTVPFIDTLGIWEASRDTITDASEATLSVDTVLVARMDSIWSISPESGTLKIGFRMLRDPVVNDIVPCRITSVDTGFVAVPENGGVLSFGKGQFPLFFSLFVGDTFSLETTLEPLLPEPVLLMTGGTPRIVRNGEVSVEWKEEGLRKSRFVEGRYGRTAFGVSRNNDTLILVTVEPYNRAKRRRGISLDHLARLLLHHGAWQAMNFDGGSSATMMLEGQTICPLSGNRGSRKITTALMVAEKILHVEMGDIPDSRKILPLE